MRYQVLDAKTEKVIGSFDPDRGGYWASKFVTYRVGGERTVNARAGDLICRPDPQA